MNTPSAETNRIPTATLLFLLLGALLGYTITFILAAIAVPDFTNAYMTKEMFALISQRDPFVLFLSSNSVMTVVYSMIGVYIVLLSMWIKNLFPGVTLWSKNNLQVMFFFLLFLVAFTAMFILFFAFTGGIFSMTDGPATSFNTVFALIGMPMALWILLYSSARIDKRSGKEYADFKNIVVLGITGSVVIFIFQAYLAIVSETFFSSIWALGGAGEPTNIGWYRAALSMILFGALTTGFLGAFITWLIRPKPIKNLMVPIILIAVTVIAGESFQRYADNELDMRFDSLNDAAGLTVLPKEPKPVSIAVLDNKQPLNTSRWDIRAKNIYGGIAPSQTVDLIPENVEKLENYIDKQRYTYYTDTAMSAMAEITKRQWDLNAFRTASFDNIHNNGSILQSMILLASSSMLPVTEANRKFLDRLSDEKVFKIQGVPAYRLAKSWIAFGDEEKAKQFYSKIGEQSKHDNYETWEKLIEKHRFSTGMISGKIHGVPAGTKIALVAESENLNLTKPHSFHRIKAVRTLRENGAFDFDHLVAGEYVLAVLFPDANIEAAKVTGGNVFSITDNTPSYEDVVISIVVQ